MTDPVSLSAEVIASLAFSKMLEKTVENFTEGALAKMDELRLKIWEKLRGNQRAEKVLATVEQGNKEELQRLAVYLQDAMEDDPQFAAEVKAMAQEINAGKLQDNSQMNQSNYDKAHGWQTKVEGGTVYMGEIHMESPKSERVKLNPPENIPSNEVVIFVGREQVLQTLHQQFEETNRVIITPAVGINPTELALQYAQFYGKKQHFYTGGVCWIQVQDADEDVGYQILNFAKYQLNLEIPGDIKLHEKTSFCWSHWQEGNVLIILDKVENFQQIKNYLPSNQSRFQLLITTEQKQLGDLDDSFEPLYLKIIEEELKNEFIFSIDNPNTSLSHNFTYILLIYGFILLIITTCSLLASYILFSSDPWINQYGKQGWIIELVRSLILLTGAIILLGVIYPKDAREVLGLGRIDYSNIKWVCGWVILIFIEIS